MICSNCGKNNAEASAFCEECGTALKVGNMQNPNPVAEIPVTENPVEVEHVAEVPKSSGTLGGTWESSTETSAPKKLIDKKPIDKKVIAVVGGALLSIVALIVVLVIVFGGGYKKPIDQYFSALNSCKAETYIKAFSKGQEDDWKKDDDIIDKYKDYLDDRKKSLEDLYEDEIGDDIKIKHKVTDAAKMSKDEIEDIDDDIENRLEDYYDDIDVQAGYRVALKVTLKGSEGKRDFFINDVKVYKINGHWCILDDIELK